MAFTINDIYNSLGLTEENGTQTLMNYIVDSAGLSGMVQAWDGSVSGLADFGASITNFQSRMNDFVAVLVDRIGLVVVNEVSLRNQLGGFKKGVMPSGRAIQEIFTDIMQAQSFNPEDAEDTLFKRNPPDVSVLFHDNWRREFFKTTIAQEQLTYAFTSIERLNAFIANIYNAIYNSNEVGEYTWTLTMIESYVNNGFATYVPVDAVVDQVTAQEFVKSAREYSTRITLPVGSRSYNNMGVQTRTEENDIFIIMDASLEAAIDVDVLAYAFNMDRASLKNRRILVENFATSGLVAVMVDREAFMIYDRIARTESVRNAQGLYWNVFFHVWQNYSISRLRNFVAFMSAGIPAVQRLTLRPLATYMRQGATMDFTGYILSTDTTSTLTATIVDSTGTAVSGATATVTMLSGDTSGGQYQVEVTLPTTVTANTNLRLQVTATWPDSSATTPVPFSVTQVAMISVLPELEAST